MLPSSLTWGSLFLRSLAGTPNGAAAPFVPAETAAANRQKRKLMEKHRASVKKGRLLNLELPLSPNFISLLKC